MRTKISFLVVSALVLTLALNSCNSQDNKSTSTEQNSAKVTYACPMHPEVTSDVAGKCPKCGMELVEKKAADKSMNMGNDTMNIKH